MNTPRKALVASFACVLIILLIAGIYPYITGQKGSTANDATASPTPTATTSPTPTPTATATPTPSPTATTTVTPSPTPEPSINVTVANSTTGSLPSLGAGSFTWKMTISGFDQPTDVALDNTGNIYVLDAGHQLVWKFSPNGTVIAKWGSFGTGDGQFTIPNSIAVDSNGYVYIADTNRIEKFTLDGTYVTQWQNIWPTNIATDSSGNVYVAVSGDCIKKYSSSGALLLQIGSPGSGESQFGQGPVDVAVDANGTIYTLDYQNSCLYEGKNEYRDTCVKVFAANGTYLYEFSSFGSADYNGLLNTPRGLTVDKNGNIYVADTDNFRVQKFTNNGTYIKQVGGYGSGKLTFEYPVNIAVDDSGCIYVVDMGAGSVQKIKG
jgi:tripartite motif-containing protein 71